MLNSVDDLRADIPGKGDEQVGFEGTTRDELSWVRRTGYVNVKNITGMTMWMAQWTHDVIITSLLRQNNVAATFWRNYDAISASCVRSAGGLLDVYLVNVSVI